MGDGHGDGHGDGPGNGQGDGQGMARGWPGGWPVQGVLTYLSQLYSSLAVSIIAEFPIIELKKTFIYS